jgi:predicted dehydrogenase
LSDEPPTAGSPIRVGIIGLGWGSLVHLPAFRSTDPYAVVACCARDRGRLQSVGERYGIADLSTDWQQFVRRDDLDLIDVATPVRLHRPMVEAAFMAGKHVLCEKPAGLDAAEVRAMAAMAATAARSGLSHAVGFELRWLPEHLAARALVRSGQLGAPSLVQLSRNVGMWHASAGQVAAWKHSLEQGGGFLNAVTAHDLDLVRLLFGEPVAVCADLLRTLPGVAPHDGGAVDAEDTVGLLLRLSSGALAVISGTAASVHGSGYRLEAAGTGGTLRLESGVHGASVRFGGAGQERPSRLAVGRRQPARRLAVARSYPLFPQVRAMTLLLEDWRPGRGEAAGADPTFADALRVQVVIDGARASAQGAGWVELT